MAICSIHNLNVSYSSAQVLWDISLHIDQGEIVSLIGVNGAGKTTLMRSISGIVRNVTGSILFEDEEMTSHSASEIVKKGIAHVPEGRRLFTGMSVADNLLMGAYLRKDKAGIKRDLEKMYHYFPRLAERKTQITGKMSGGEQQMCAIGRALMSSPKLLLIDELSLGLAPVMIDELILIIKQLQKEGLSILLVEQDVQTGLEISSRAYVVEHGSIVLSGPSTDLLQNEQVKASYLGM